MSVTFEVAGLGTWQPLFIMEDDIRRLGRAIVHELLGNETPAVTLLPTLTRSGSLEILAEDASSAATGMQLLAAAQPVTLTYTERPDLNMRFVVTDEITQQTDLETQQVVIITVPFQEVPL